MNEYIIFGFLTVVLLTMTGFILSVINEDIKELKEFETKH